MNQLIYYLLQMIAASGLFYGYYHLALRNKKFHRYNRFYLLSTVCISILIPFLNIPVYFTHFETESSFVLKTLRVISFPADESEGVVVSSGKSAFANWFTLTSVLWSAYILVALIVFLKIIFSLKRLHEIVNSNPVEKLQQINFVNTDEPGTPFSFFRWLFWNRKIELRSEKGEQIFRHELFHIQQKHSMDILFMELLIAICWFNPFFHLVKKELKAIHEFLADEFAIHKNARPDDPVGREKWQYAELLLMQALNTQNPLVNPFFHNQIKRRIAMITSSKKPGHQYLRKLLVLPVAAVVVALFAFSYRHIQTSENLPAIFKKSISDTSKPKENRILIEMPGVTMPPLKKNIPTEKNLQSWQDSKIYGVWVDEKRIINNELSKYEPNDFSHYFVSKLSKNAINYGKHYYQINLMTNNYYENYLKHYDPNKTYKSFAVIRRDTLPERLKKFDSYLIVIDGKVEPEKKFSQLDSTFFFDQIRTIKLLDEKTAMAKYKDNGKNGVMEIYTKKSPEEKIIEKIVREEKKIQSYTDNKVFEKMDVEPSFPGGEKEWRRYLERNLDPSIPVKKGLKSGSYTVIVQFIVDKVGKISDVKALTKHGYGMEEHVINLIRKGPYWIPGNQNGQNVKAYKKQPVTFVIGDGKPDHSTDVSKKVEEKKYLTEVVVTGAGINQNKVFEKFETPPTFPGGDTAWRRFLEKNIDANVPVKNGASAGSYKVELQFIVNSDGSITDLKALSTKGYGMEEECLRMMKLSPNWMPATVKGKKVAAYKKQPITFVVSEE